MPRDERIEGRVGDAPAEERSRPSDDREAQAEAVLADSDERQAERAAEADG